MKRLILIQNDFSGAGKTTLMRSLQCYLDRHQVPHLDLCITESLEGGDDSIHRLPFDTLHRDGISPYLQAAELVLVEVESGLSEAVAEYFNHSGVMDSLQDSVEFLIALPVTGEEESFDGVISAAHAFSDCAQYAVFHMPNGSEYDDEDSSQWDHSKGARLMDLLDGVDLRLPALSALLEAELHSIDLDLAGALSHAWHDMPLKGLLSDWTFKMAAHIDPARRFLFGDAFRPAVAATNRRPTPTRSKGKQKEMLIPA